jgi:hypothetical protein
MNNLNLKSAGKCDDFVRDKNPEFLSDLSPLKHLPQLQDQYRIITLISHRNHVQKLTAKKDQLVVVTDWLTWRYCVDAGHDSIHIEAMVEQWPEESGDPDYHYYNSATWMYAENHDITLFRGVSLGKQFNKKLGLFRLGFIRTWHALDRICQHFQPTQMEFFDIRSDHDSLTEFAKVSLVTGITEKHQISVIDRYDRMSSDPYAFHDLPQQIQSQKPKILKFFLLNFYDIVIEILFGARFLFIKPGRRIYFLLNWPALKVLFENKMSTELHPVILARQFPKSIGFILNCWRKNILLARLPSGHLSKSEKTHVAKISGLIEKSFAKSSTLLDIAQQDFIKNTFLQPGMLRRAACEVKSYDILFDRLRIKHLVVGDAENGTCRILLELAHKKNIHADEMLNGVFLTDEYSDTRNGDAIHLPYVNRLLTWGEHDEKWMAGRSSEMATVRIGYPALGIVQSKFTDPSLPHKKALVLPISMEGVKALNTNIFPTIVDTVRGLKEMGCTEIRIKVHVGHPVKNYFEMIARYFDLDCEISQSRILAHHIDWADFVIGPIDSGAFVETMAKGTPYYPMRLFPSSLKKKYFGNVVPSESVPELLTAIQQRNFPDLKQTLEYFCSASSIPNASKQVWEVLEQSRQSHFHSK